MLACFQIRAKIIEKKIATRKRKNEEKSSSDGKGKDMKPFEYETTKFNRPPP
jgi:hypothetical protein